MCVYLEVGGAIWFKKKTSPAPEANSFSDFVKLFAVVGLFVELVNKFCSIIIIKTELNFLDL